MGPVGAPTAPPHSATWSRAADQSLPLQSRSVLLVAARSSRQALQHSTNHSSICSTFNADSRSRELDVNGSHLIPLQIRRAASLLRLYVFGDVHRQHRWCRCIPKLPIPIQTTPLSDLTGMHLVRLRHVPHTSPGLQRCFRDLASFLD